MFVIAAGQRTKRIGSLGSGEKKERKQERERLKKKKKKAFGQMSHSSLLPSTSGCVHVWHTRKTSPRATAQGLSGVCYGVGGIVLSRLRCNFQEEKQIQRMLLFPVIGSGVVMVEGFLFCFCFSSVWPPPPSTRSAPLWCSAGSNYVTHTYSQTRCDFWDFLLMCIYT